jgi:hypothetical protein
MKITPHNYTDLRHAIACAMARAMFVTNYADLADENEGLPRAMSGQDWMMVAPDTPEEYVHEAYRLMGRLEQANGMNIHALFAKVCQLDGASYTATPSGGEYVRDFGHCIAMEAMGTGVGWADDHAEHGLKVPLIEVHGELV